MKTKQKEEKELIMKEIEEEKNKLFLLEEENLKKSFGYFFVKPLFLSLIIGVILKFLKFSDTNIIGGFLITFFLLLFIFSYKTKKDYEQRNQRIKAEKIKIQASIFAKVKRLKEIEKDS